MRLRIIQHGILSLGVLWVVGAAHAQSTDGSETTPTPSTESDEAQQTAEASEDIQAPEDTESSETSTEPLVVQEVTATPTARERLDIAVRTYQLGRRDEARTLLANILLDTTIDDEDLIQECRVYMGELLYIQGDEEGAKQFFEQVIRLNPAYLIDPFRHPPDVCGFFNYVRAYVAPFPTVSTAPPPVTQIPPLHWTAWLPIGGFYQLSHGQTRKGTAFLTSEIVLLTASTSLFGVLLNSRVVSDNDDAAMTQFLRLRTTQQTITVGYWGVWAWARLDAKRHWRNSGLTPTPQSHVVPTRTLPLAVRFDIPF